VSVLPNGRARSRRCFYGARSYARCSAGGLASAVLSAPGRLADGAAASNAPCPMEYKRLTVKARLALSPRIGYRATLPLRSQQVLRRVHVVARSAPRA